MAYQAIGRGTSANDGTGDDLRTGAGKLNANFVEVYTYLGDGSTLSSDAVVTATATQTLTNKSLTSPTITGTGAIAGTFTGNITGNVTGNADTATALATARTIAGQSFDGTANITIAAADLSDVDQALATTDSPTFVSVSANLTGNVTGNVSGNVTGNLDGIVGGSTPAAGSFTTVSASGAIQLAVFADGTARDAAIAAPAAGMLCFLTDNGSAASKAQVYDGSAWVDLH